MKSRRGVCAFAVRLEGGLVQILRSTVRENGAIRNPGALDFLGEGKTDGSGGAV